MEIEIISFGKISEFISNQRIIVDGVNDTDGLKTHLEATFPLLSGTKYKFALNKTIVQGNSQITHNDIVAIMPPFSGG